MVAAGRGQLEITEQLLNLGADTGVKACNNWTALDWAVSYNQSATVDLLEAYM